MVYVEVRSYQKDAVIILKKNLYLDNRVTQFIYLMNKVKTP